MDFSSPWFLAVMIMCGAYISAWFIRRVVELRFPYLRPTKMSAKLAVEDTSLAGSRVTGAVCLYSTVFAEWWNTLILYALAPLAGIGLALLARTADNYPPELHPTWLTIVFGTTLGFLSGLGFKAFKKIFADKVGIVDDAVSTSGPPAPPGS